MDLTSPVLAGVLVALTLVVGVGLVWGPTRQGRHATRFDPSSWRWGVRPAPRRWWHALGRLVAVLLAQLLAVLSAFVLVNTQLRLFVSTDDLVGKPAPATLEEAPAGGGDSSVPQTDGKRLPSGARVVSMDLSGQASKARGNVLVWLPPGYDDALAGQDLPVLYFMPGQPGHPQAMLDQFEIDQRASKVIRSGAAKPFIVVLPPIAIAPPRSTECLDVPGGPQATTWLVDDVGRAVSERFRATKDRQKWSLSGWSTGGYCSAYLLFNHRDRFGAAVSIGGYFHAWADHSTGDLFGGDPNRQKAADILGRLRSEQPVPTKLLNITSKGDPASWGGHGSEGDAGPAVDAAARWPGTAKIVLERGGHTPDTYHEAFSQSLEWLGRVNGL